MVVSVGRTLLADFRRELAHLLLVGAGNDHLVGRGNINGDAVDLGNDDLVGIAQVHDHQW